MTTGAARSTSQPRTFGSDETMPWLFRAADAASNGGQRAFMQFTSVTLMVLVAAAGIGPIIGAINGSEAAGRWSALVAAAAFVVAIIERSYALTARPERAWYEGRALAESTKTLAWRYAVGAAPYELAGKDVDQRCADRLRSIMHSFPELVLNLPGAHSVQITPEMRSLRAASLDERRQAYREQRIEDQRAWYAGRAARHGKRGQRLALLSLLAECCGATLAWERAHQDTTVAKAYGVAAQELATISDLIDGQRDEDSWSRFVVESEDAISREHTLWKASRSVDTQPAAAEQKQ
jgi:hypothetical protein